MLNRKGLTEFGNLLGKDDHSIFFFEITVYIFLPLVYNEPNRYKQHFYPDQIFNQILSTKLGYILVQALK